MKLKVLNTLWPTDNRSKKVQLLYFIFISFFIAIVGNASVDGQGIRSLKVKKGHPVLFVTPEMVDEIRQKKEDLEGFHNYVKSSREKSTDDPGDIGLIRSEVDKMTLKGHVDYYINDCSAYGVDAYINDNALSKAYAEQYLLSLLAIPISGDDDMPIRGKLFAMGVLYDWIYDELDESQRKEIRNEILDMVDYVDGKWHYVSRANAGGHSRFGNISVLVGLLPIFHDIEAENADRYFKYLQYVVHNWIDIFNPLQEWVNRGGSHSMGWAYGASYSTFYPYMVWEFATDEASWLTDWQREKAYFNLYGLRNDYNGSERQSGAYDNFPFWEDVWASDYSANLQGMQVLFSAGYYGDDHAKWLYNHLKGRNINGWMFDDNPWDILYNNFLEDDGKSPYDLALSSHYKNSGFVLMRDSWDFNQNTLMVFKSASFYGAGHHHKDQNAFTIYYKGPLAIDAGTYEATGGWGSSHFWNYYTRTVAHNTMLIYNPSEKFNGYSNDGGQYFFSIDDPGYKDVIEGGNNHLDGIQQYEENSYYTYTMGDATKAYSSSKLSAFKRSIVYLRNHSYNHPAIVVYDKVVSTNPDFRKTWLLHSVKEPFVENRLVTITNDDGINSENRGVLYQETILPQNAEIVVIGGRENNQEFYVADDGKGNPHNYNEEAVYDHPSERQARELREGGEWRVEVSPKENREADEFLHVLSVTDGDPGFLAVQTQYISSENMDGVIVSDHDGEESTLVLFCRNNTTLDEFIEISGDLQFNRVLITGLNPAEKYAIEYSATGFSVKSSETAALISSEQGTLYLDSSFMPVLAYFDYNIDKCSKDVFFFGGAVNNNISDWLWDFGDGNQSALQNPVHTYDIAGTYSVTLITTANAITDTCYKEVTILPVIGMPEVTGDEKCNSGTITLTASGGGGNHYKWYDAPVGGDLVEEGDTYTTPGLISSKSYYVVSVIPGTPVTMNGAKADSSGKGNYYKWDDDIAIWGLKFDAGTDMVLKSVKVYNGESENGSYIGERTFTVENSSGDTVATAVVDVVEGEQRLILNMSVPAGTGYALLADSHVGLWRTTEGATYPYAIGNAVSVTGGVRFDGIPPAELTAYYFFYDWEIEASGDSASCRKAVEATIIPPVNSAFRYDVYDTVVFFTSVSMCDSYLWDFGDGTNSTEENPVHVYSGYDSYLVKLVSTNSCGSGSTEEFVSVEKTVGTSVLFEKDELLFYVFPNPANDILYLQSKTEPDTKKIIYIYNSSGNVVKTLGSDGLSINQINISDLPSGIYFIKISKDGTLVPKLIKFVISR